MITLLALKEGSCDIRVNNRIPDDAAHDILSLVCEPHEQDWIDGGEFNFDSPQVLEHVDFSGLQQTSAKLA